MTGRAQEELTRAIVHDAVHKYIATRRERIDLFVDRHFTLAGSLELHRRAIGWDLLKSRWRWAERPWTSNCHAKQVFSDSSVTPIRSQIPTVIDGISPRKLGSHWTLRWRKGDSNPRSLSRSKRCWGTPSGPKSGSG